MKTLLFTSEYPPFRGGIANYYASLVKYWPEPGSLSVYHTASISRRRFSWLKSIFSLSRRLKAENINYVLVGQILPLGTAAWLLSLVRPFRYAVFLHGMDLSFALRSGRKRYLAGLILRRATKIIAANSQVAAQAKEFVPALEKKIVVVNPGVSEEIPVLDGQWLEELKSAYSLSGKTVLLALGRLVKRKGVDMTMAALGLVPEPLISSLVYVVAGQGPDQEYLKSLVPERLSRRVIFLGEVNEEEKWAWLNLADVFIMPSRNIAGDYEGFGIVYLEANLCGKPVIAGRSGGVADAVADGDSGLLVDPQSPEAIRDAIWRLANDRDFARRLGNQGRERAKKEFGWPKQARLVWEAIQEEKL